MLIVFLTISENVLIAAIGGFVTIVVALTGIVTMIVKNKLEKVATKIDGRMDELLELTKKATKAEGKLEEKTEQEEKNNKPIKKK